MRPQASAAFAVAAALAIVVATVTQSGSAASEEATGQPALGFGTDPIKLGNGFTLQLTGVGLALFGGKPLTITLRRNVRRVVEEHSWNFTLPSGLLSVRPDFGDVTLTTKRALGSYGSISLRATDLGTIRRVRHCSGEMVWKRTATFTGTFRFNSRSAFGAVTRRTFRGWIGSPDCAPGFRGTVCANHDRLHAWSGSNSLEAERWPDGVRFVRFTSQDSAAAEPASVSHRLTLTSLPAGAITLAPDLGSGAVNASAGAPLLTGGLTFTAQAPLDTSAIRCTKRGVPSRSGTTSGTVTATFAHLGAQTLTNPAGQLVRYR